MSKQIRNIAVKSLTLGQPESILLPRNYAIRGLVLQLAGSVTVTGTTGNGGVNDAGIWHTISNIRVRRDGRDTVISIPGFLLYALNRIFYGTAPKLTNATTGAAQTNTALTGGLILPFENVMGIKPFDTLLKGSGLSSLDLLVDTQAISNMFGSAWANAAAVGTTAMSLSVDAVEEVGVNNFVFGDIRMSLISKANVAATSSNFQIKPLPVGNYYKGFLLFAIDSTDGASDAVITNIKLKSGSEVIVDQPALNCKDLMKLTHQQETAVQTGVYYLDLMSDGMLNQCLDVTPASGRETLEMELAVTKGTATTDIYVVGLEYIPPVIAKK